MRKAEVRHLDYNSVLNISRFIKVTSIQYVNDGVVIATSSGEEGYFPNEKLDSVFSWFEDDKVVV